MFEKARKKVANKIFHQPEVLEPEHQKIDEVFNDEDIENLRQWFGILHEQSPEFLEGRDYSLAEKLYKFTGFRIPNSIKEGIQEEPELLPLPSEGRISEE